MKTRLHDNFRWMELASLTGNWSANGAAGKWNFSIYVDRMSRCVCGYSFSGG